MPSAAQYFGRTANKFFTKWLSNRSIYIKPDYKDDKNQAALSRHHSVFHGTVNDTPMHDSYAVTFQEQPDFFSLNTCDD